MWALIIIFFLGFMALLVGNSCAEITKYSETEYQKTEQVSNIVSIRHTKNTIRAINSEIDELQNRIQSLRDRKAALQAEIDEAKSKGVEEPVEQ